MQMLNDSDDEESFTSFGENSESDFSDIIGETINSKSEVSSWYIHITN